MWPSNNQQQWSAGQPPPSHLQQPNLQIGIGGQMMGYGNANQNASQVQSNMNPYQPQQQFNPMIMQNQMIPPNQMIMPQNQMNNQLQYQQQQIGQQPPQQLQYGYGASYEGQVFHPPPPPPQIHTTMNPMNVNSIGIGNNNIMVPPPPPPPGVPPPPPNQQKFYCQLCAVSCPNEYSLQQHMSGKKHKEQEDMISKRSGGISNINKNHKAANRPPQHHRREHPTEFYCQICQVSCQSERDYRQHLNGAQHKKIVAGGPQTFYCKVCNIYCPDNVSYEQHLNGINHRKQLERGTSHKKTDVATFHCQVCKVTCQTDVAFAQHMKGERHEKQVANLNKMKEHYTEEHYKLFHCQVCNVTSSTEYNYQQHINGKKHKKKAAQLGTAAVVMGSTGPSPPPRSSNTTALPKPPPASSKDAKEIRPIISKSSNVKEELDSDEEGEIDEEQEEIDKLYDEENLMTQEANNEADKVAIKEESEDSDADDMFGDDGGRAAGTIDKPEEEEQVDVDGDETDMFGEEDDDSEAKGINVPPSGEPSGDNSNMEGPEPPTEDDTGEIDHDLQDKINYYGMGATANDEDDEHEEMECNYESWSGRLKQIDKIGNQRPDDESKEEAVDDMFGDSPIKSPRKKRSSRWKKIDENEVKKEDPMVLDSGLGFVLDYGSGKETAPSQAPGFVLDYSPTIPFGDLNHYHQEEPKLALATREGVPAGEEIQINSNGDEIEMFGEEDEKEKDGVYTQLTTSGTTNKETSQLHEVNEDDDDEMFGSGSDNEDVTAQPPDHNMTTQNGTPTSAQKDGASSTMTTADALAAARSRAHMPAPALKRAKISAQQYQPVKLPENITQYSITSSKHVYYPPLHPDKYWSDLRNWDFVKELNNASCPKSNESGAKRPIESSERSKSENDVALPDVYESVDQYKALWSPLLIKEAQAQILSEMLASRSVNGVAVKLNLSARSGEGSKSLDPTVVVHVQASTKGAGVGCSISTNDILLFVRQSSTMDEAFEGKAFVSEGNGNLRSPLQGRLGLVGHAINYRRSSIDGLLVRVSKNCWNQFSTLDELFLIRLGSNVTAMREFNALIKADTIPLTNYILDGKFSNNKVENSENDAGSEKMVFNPLASGGDALPVGFRISVKSKMNNSQQKAIIASATEYGDGGFTLIKGPPGTGKSTTLVSILNALHLRQYQQYYSAIEKVITESTASTYYEELAALHKAAEVKPRILVCAPSNAGIDNVVLKIMTDKFVDGQGGKYSPNIVRVGAGITNPKFDVVSLKRAVDTIIQSSSDMAKLDRIIATSRKTLKRFQNEIRKLRERIIAMVESCPYAISADWEIRIDEESFDQSGRVVFVNHSKKTTTFDVPNPKRPDEKKLDIHSLPHYRSLMKNLTKYVERHNNETSSLEKYILVQNAAHAKMEGVSDESLIPLLETHVLNSSHIVLTTLGSSGSNIVTSASKFKVVVIDEAAQSAEPSTLVALQLGSSHAILVGDPQQLPATIFSVSGRSTKYDRSLFQRLEEAGHHVHLLNTQYRMNPLISEFPRHIFYDGKLLDGQHVLESDFGDPLKTIIRIKFPYIQPFCIFDLDSKEEREGTSLSNKSEAQLVLQLYRTLERETDGLLAKSRVAIITPYSQQLSLLHTLFNQRYGNKYQSRVEISTVDAFQGREQGIVIYSCVRAAGGGRGIGFLSDVQRMNVALTRAKHFLFVIARRKSIIVNPYWRKLVDFARSKSAVIQVPFASGANQFRPTTTLRSSLLKSSSAKKVSFGGVDTRLYQVSSNANNTFNDIFPDLTKLRPMDA